MTTKHKPNQADQKESKLWAISRLASVGAGKGKISMGVSVFDLVNREAHRAHRLTLISAGTKGPTLGVSGSFKRSAYGEFTTTRPVSFKDFNRIWMEVKKTDAGIYAWTEIKLRDGLSPMSKMLGSTKVKGWGAGVPEWKGKQQGVTEVLYSDGNIVGPGEILLVIPELPPPDVELETQGESSMNVAYKVPTDALFDFNRHDIKQTAGWVLHEAGDFIKKLSGSGRGRIFITGHTDSVGSPEYNLKLSKQRAEAVAKWLVQENYATAAEVNTEGKGETKPIEANKLPNGNDHPYGREKNRRVEILFMT